MYLQKLSPKTSSQAVKLTINGHNAIVCFQKIKLIQQCGTLLNK